MANKTIILMEDGLISRVMTNDPDAEIVVIDLDTDGIPEYQQVDSPEGPAYITCKFLEYRPVDWDLYDALNISLIDPKVTIRDTPIEDLGVSKEEVLSALEAYNSASEDSKEDLLVQLLADYPGYFQLSPSDDEE